MLPKTPGVNPTVSHPVATVTSRKHTIKPLQGGQTYTATSFDVAMLVDSAGTSGHFRVRFYDTNSKPIPDGSIQPVTPGTQAGLKSALSAILLVPAHAGETLPQLLLRAAAPYVQATYGATLVAG